MLVPFDMLNIDIRSINDKCCLYNLQGGFVSGLITNKKIDPRVDRTRKLIGEAFLAVLDERGFEDLTVNDITERAGINRATFYSHFVDKHELLSHEVRKRFLEVIGAQGLAERSLEVAAVRELFLTMCDFVSAAYAHCKPPMTHLDWVMRDEITSLGAELLMGWAAEPADRAALQLATTAASSALYGLVVLWSRSKGRATAEDFGRRALPLVTGLLGLS
jgi:AcrR family transcriptional regulator